VKALKCLNCGISVVVNDNASAYCKKCHMPLHENQYLNNELGLTKDEPVKRKYVHQLKNKKIKRRKKKKR